MGNTMNLEQLYEQAQQLIGQNNHDEAYKRLKRLDNAAPNHPGILYLLGICQSKSGNKLNAIKTYRRVLELMPSFVEAMNNLGLDLLEQNQPQEALTLFERATTLRPDFSEAWINKSVALIDLKMLEEASAILLKLQETAPDTKGISQNLGSILLERNRYAEASTYFLRALGEDPSDEKSLFMYGSCLQMLNRPVDAIKFYRETLKLNPTHKRANGRIVEMLLRLCEWPPSFDVYAKALLKNDTNISHPLVALYLSQDPVDTLISSSRFSQTTRKSIQITHSSNTKIRIGFFSSDLREHPVGFLTAGLFESIDHNLFEIYCYSLERISNLNPWGERIAKSCDYFHLVGNFTNDALVNLARSHSLDVAIDLNGHTAHARTQIFAERVSPIQIQYLGFPGTMGGDFFEYTIADSIVIPQTQQKFYSEKIIYLPECFQVNDDKRLINKTASRSDLGLPETGFIFACFNQASKITPTVFEHWMNILKATPDSFLWLAEENPEQVVNLREHAKNRDVSGERLIFAGRLPYASHLGRYRHADLVLDTFPFNGGTTTSDALWGGAPVITYPGEAYASRMAASLLRSVELDELITESLDAYEALAIKLASNPIKLNELRQRLHNHLSSAPVFNTKRFTRHFEKGLELAVERSRNGLKPDHIFVPLLAE